MSSIVLLDPDFLSAHLAAFDLFAPYLSGWRKRAVPALGHLPVRMIANGSVDRAVHGWIADGCSRSAVKNSLAALVRVGRPCTTGLTATRCRRPLTEADRAVGYWWDISMRQVEVSRTIGV